MTKSNASRFELQSARCSKNIEDSELVLSTLKSLRRLSLMNNKWQYLFPAEIKNLCETLKFIDLRGCHIIMFGDDKTTLGMYQLAETFANVLSVYVDEISIENVYDELGKLNNIETIRLVCW